MNLKSVRSTLAVCALRALAAGCCVFSLVCSTHISGRLCAADGPATSLAGLKEHRSRYFVVHTDLSDDEAAKLIARLESTLTAISDYWQSPLRGTIEFYVIDDVEHWCGGNAFPGNVNMVIRNVGGVTESRRQSATSNGEFQATVYAANRPGVAEHELVHAYCIQTFGALGPDWYKEGIAQMSHNRRDGERGVACDPEMLAAVRKGPRRTLHQVVNTKLTSSIGNSLDQALDRGNKLTIETQPHDEVWLQENSDAVQQTWQSYYWSWALCHLLHHNPNYSERFRMLGRGYLTKQDIDFERAFGHIADNINFEYQFFIDHVDQGYRSDLCSWNWDKKFRPLTGIEQMVTRVLAARGYQPTGLEVSAKESYTYRAEGTWTLEPDAAAVTADGDQQGLGKLEAVVMKNYKLSKPMLLKAEGTLTAPADGRLYLRCRDDWGKLGDNQGAMLVRFRKAEATPAETARVRRPINQRRAAGRS